MRCLAVCGPAADRSSALRLETVAIGGVPLAFGLLQREEPAFDPQAEGSRHQVLVRVRAFSLNFRDKGIMLTEARAMAPDGTFPVGSEFVGEVLACGAGVDRFRVGDRVFGDNAYPSAGVAGVIPGIPNNNASVEVQPFHQAKLAKVPEGMPDEVAAAFTLGAQTSYSMIRRLALAPGEKVLVMAARSNTSLFALQALRAVPVDVYGVTTASGYRQRIEALGVKRLVEVDRSLVSLLENPEILELAQALGGFHAVIDPFADLHLGKVLDVMRFFGRYTSCGIFDQYSHLVDAPPPLPRRGGRDVMLGLLMRNISFVGNCLGRKEDLESARADYAAGRLEVTLDSVHGGTDIGPFLERTFNAPDRFGKVAFVYG